MALKLPRLPSTPPTHQTLQLWWQRVVEEIEAQEAAQDGLILELQQAQADILTAQATGDDAAATALVSSRELARLSSYPSPSNILSAIDVGADCSITISNHNRIYPVQGSIDVPDVSITGTTLTGLANSTGYYIYYDDATLASETPTFVATTSGAIASVGSAAGRHYVGYIITPADGATGTDGGGYRSPGGIEP